MLDFADEPVSVLAVAPVRPRKRRARVLDLDTAIEVSSTELKSWQTRFLENMKKQTVSRKTAREKAVLKNNAKIFVWEYRGEIIHPDLRRIFCVRRPTQVFERDQPVAVLGSEEFQQSFQFAEPEAPMQQEILDRDIEIGRRAPSDEQDGQSLRLSTLPWNLSREVSAVPSVSGNAMLGGLSSLNTPRQFSFIQTPVLRSRQTSARPGSRISGAVALGGLERLDSLDPPVTQAATEQSPSMRDDEQAVGKGEDAVMRALTDTQLANNSQLILQTMEQESHNFFE